MQREAQNLTCIVGLVKDGTVWIGGDSAGVRWTSLYIRADEKVFTKPPFVFGFTSSFRMGQVIRYCIQFPVPPLDKEFLMQYMVREFTNTLRAGLKETGFLKKENEVEQGGEFLVGIGGRLFLVHSDFQIAEMRTPGAACGCGEELALGALDMALKMNSQSTVDVILGDVLAIVASRSSSVAPPFCIVSGGTVAEIESANRKRH